ncbi:hypothetical protein [Oxalicibacterium faecigallinarum]|uniref:hypothetical protein n=1 Tax=Oxalicibacterium faecigallinarum TaxID=573741 RepID=UPI0016680AAF|nr:hypothetical protein [Oxalicibacterium faecigallinarum]
MSDWNKMLKSRLYSTAINAACARARKTLSDAHVRHLVQKWARKREDEASALNHRQLEFLHC